MSVSYNVKSRVSKRMSGYIERLITECQEKTARIEELEFERDQAYVAGASEVLNSTVVKEFVPASTRRNLRPGRFGTSARKKTQGF